MVTFTQKCLHVFFLTQDYVLVFYQDAENAEASDAGQIQAIEATDVIMFQSAVRVLF